MAMEACFTIPGEAFAQPLDHIRFAIAKDCSNIGREPTFDPY